MRVLVTGATGNIGRMVVDHLVATGGCTVQVSRDEAVAAIDPDLGHDACWYVDTILAGSVDQHPEPTELTAQLLGRPATTFATWAREHVDRFG